MQKKTQAQILKKFQIDQLNAMQEEAAEAINSNDEVILLSPTGTGKTLAFLLPIVENLIASSALIQVIIITPSRELAIQIDQVAREMGSGYKTNAFYGGRNFSKDKLSLNTPPAILVGTPGRIADHLKRTTFDTTGIKTLVLDEFDKSLEIGFESEMDFICSQLKNVTKKILTSATQDVDIPRFINLRKPHYVNYLGEVDSQLIIKKIISPEKDKLETLYKTLCHLGNKSGIIFCNFKDSIRRISEYLSEKEINHGCFFGGMEQVDRERTLIKFRNGTQRIIIATDLAARGLDIPAIEFIIHYHLPIRKTEFTHRNGRTARMKKDGSAYVLLWEKERAPDFILTDDIETLVEKPNPDPSTWTTLFVSGGRKDKISKGDIVGLFIKQGNITVDQIGIIELKDDCAFVAVHSEKSDDLIQLLNNSKIKKRKIRITKI